MLCCYVSGGVVVRCAKMAENRQDKLVQLKNAERVLSMDTTNLEKDLAGLNFDVRILHEAPMGNVWLSGSRPSSASRGETMHWFAYLGPDPCDSEEERETKIKTFKERQNEERQKRLEDMKSQALAAQRFKEQKEQERRQRLEELRVKEDERRQQVEERKRAINEAERDRLESILKRNQEREARIEAKRRNERSSLVFAFGSSTPRVLGPGETSSSFWGHRRATSTQNIMYAAAPLTRRQSERELDGGSKKRATSAGGLERSGEDMRMSTSMYAVFHWGDESNSSKPSNPSSSAQAISNSTSNNLATTPQHPAGCISGYVGRRRTDLMPTIPAKDQPTTPPRKSFMRSPAPSRPSSSLSQQSTSSVTSSVTMRSRPTAAPRRQRPASIAVTGITNEIKNGMLDLKKPDNKPPLPKSRKSSLVKSQEKIGKKKSLASPTDGTQKNIVSPTATPPTLIENISNTRQAAIDKDNKNLKNNDTFENSLQNEDVKSIDSEDSKQAEMHDNAQIAQLIDIEQDNEPVEIEKLVEAPKETDLLSLEKCDIEKKIEKMEITDEIIISNKSDSQPTNTENLSADVDMTASFTSKPRITTEEEAKAALAERRRIAREEAEKQAELERLRIEEERRLEMERQQREEEQQRQLIEMQRAAEEERLKEAIKEAQKREEEEKLRREEEKRLKLLKEEAERKAREEAERQKAELQERLKNEEKEREARRKRVEAIMLRTRGKNNSSNTSQTDEKNAENKFDSKVNGSKTEASENGHKNGKDIETVDNIIPVDTIKNANTVTTTTLSTDDTLNSNDAWQRNSQTDLLM